MKIPVSVAATCAMLLAHEAVACSVGDIKIKEWSWHVESGYVIAVGELTNTCQEPTGVQLQITYRSASGAVVDVDEGRPASTRNIPPGDYAFKMMGEATAQPKSADIRIIDVRHW
jgi:hypothetical protein